jgi:amidase
MNKDFDVVETTIADVLRAYSSGAFTARQLVQAYIDRINTYDQQGPVINALVSLNREALAEADRLDGLLKDKGLSGPLHGIPRSYAGARLLCCGKVTQCGCDFYR